MEVSITPRRNKVGKQFGFAWFEEVEDSRLLVISRDNIQIGRTKFTQTSLGSSVRLCRVLGCQEDGGCQGCRLKRVENSVGRNGNLQVGAPRNHNNLSNLNGNRNRSFVEVVVNNCTKV